MKPFIFVLSLLFVSTIYADLTLLEGKKRSSRLSTIQKVNMNAVDVGPSKTVVLGYRFKSTAGLDSITSTGEGLAAYKGVPKVAFKGEYGKALIYPNPAKHLEEAEMIYYLPDNVDIELRMYDMLANEILRSTFFAGTPGGQMGANVLKFNTLTFAGYELSAGVYFVVLVNNGKVLMKTKLAVVP